MGYLSGYVADLDWEVRKLTEIKDKFKAAARHYRDDYQRVDDAATYWQDNFVNLFNEVHNAISLDADEHSDGEVIDIIVNSLKKYSGESDEQKEVNW